MEVTCGATWTNPKTGFGQLYNITLTDEDAAQDIVDWEDWSQKQRRKWLSADGDEEVVRYMAAQGVIDKGYATQRLAEIQQRKADAQSGGAK